MYPLYLDDSGSPANKKEEYFVLGGVCILDQNVRWLSKQLDDLATAIHPIDPGGLEFHASEIFSARKAPWNSIKDKKDRAKVLKDVLSPLRRVRNGMVFACAIHKKSFQGFDPVELAFEDLCTRFELYLNRLRHQGEPHKGLIVLDESTYETSLQKLATSFFQAGTRWRNSIRDIIEVPLFVESKASRLIQLADHVAYAVFRRYEHRDLNYFDCIEGCFDCEDGKFHSLVHKQSYNPHCTCPACITRKHHPERIVITP